MSQADYNKELNELLAMEPPKPESSHNYIIGGASPEPSAVPTQPQDQDLCQWQVGANGKFRPAAKTVVSLPAGAYMIGHDQTGPYVTQQSLMSDEIIELPESANILVLNVIRKFWDSRKRYTDHGLIFKRGVLLWGPPGSGKTVTVHLLTRDLIAKGGIVLFCGNADTTSYMIRAIRRIEKKRPLILIYEDIDEIISQQGEHTILALLDGEQQTDNIVSIATTNYPEKLGARIVNRPSRFDDRIFVGMPTEIARTAYLTQAVGSGKSVDIAKWAKDTRGLSIAHLRELVAAVMCLDQDYDDVLSRLRSMNDRPKEVEGYATRTMGFEGRAALGPF